jgi:hypothetical protein
MNKLSMLSKGFVNKAVALAIVTTVSSTVGATQLDVTNEADKSSERVAVTEKITDKSHPDFLRCRTEAIIGSLARKRKVCLTNKQWAEARKKGHRLADGAISAIQVMSGGGSFTDGK